MGWVGLVTEADGVVGDGTDQTTALQAAVDQVSANGGGTVRLPPGVIGVRNGPSSSAGCIQLPDNVRLVGAGIGVTTIRLLDAQDVAFEVIGILRTPSGVVNTHITVADLTIDGNKAANSTAGHRVIGLYCGVTPQQTLTDTDIRLQNVEIQNCSSYGFDPHERVTRLHIEGCIAHDNGVDGFVLDGCFGATVIGCYAYNNARHGINVITGSADCTLANCHAFGNISTGLTIQNGAKRITVNGGTYRNNTSAGIRINGLPLAAPEVDTTPGGSNKIIGAQINGNGGHGVHLVGASHNTLIGNTVLDNSTASPGASHGIYLDESAGVFSTNNEIVANKVRSTTAGQHGYGIGEASASDGSNYILGNQIVGSGTDLRLLGSVDQLAGGGGSTATGPGTPVFVKRDNAGDPWTLGDTTVAADFTKIRANGQNVTYQSPDAAKPGFGTGASDQRRWDAWVAYPVATFDPATVPGLLLYWNPNSISAADGTAVTSLPATVGGVALGQSTAARQPSVQTVGGQRVIRYTPDGTATNDDELVATLATQAQPVTVAFVHSIAGTTAQQILDGGVQILTSTTQLQAYAGTTLSMTTTIPDAALGVTVVVFTGTTTRIYRNGGTPTVGNAGTTGMAATFRVGRHGTSGRPFNGDMGSITVHSGALTSAQVQSLGAGLASQYPTATAWAAVTG